MNLKTRLTIKFMSQVFLLFGIVCALGIAFMAYVTAVNVGGASGANPVLIVKSMPSATSVEGQQVRVSPLLLANVRDVRGWIQILDGRGDEIYQYHRPAQVPAAYPPGLLLEYRAYPARYGYQVYSWYDKVDGQDLTWLLGVPYHEQSKLQTVAPYALMLLLLIVSVVAAIIIALLFGRRLGAPLLHMLSWLQGLARGSYEEPMDGKGIGRSRRKNGQLRNSFRLYEEVIAALEHLASVLNRAQVERKRLEISREEWITGVSHDLKTPLSSVKGYADLLSAPQYQWSAEEVREFGGIIVEKATHMEALIEDLGLTFRLKNEGMPLTSVPQNVTEIVRRATIDLVNHPDVELENVRFEGKEEEIRYPVDRKWFQRALDNLLANAVVHNPPNTQITVQITRETSIETKYPGVLIEITDNGQGMDEDTVLHLFDRYYRGTNTTAKHSNGSGLGCAIAKQLIEAHGGTVEVHSELGVGTSFYIHLPPKS